MSGVGLLPLVILVLRPFISWEGSRQPSEHVLARPVDLSPHLPYRESPEVTEAKGLSCSGWKFQWTQCPFRKKKKKKSMFSLLHPWPAAFSPALRLKSQSGTLTGCVPNCPHHRVETAQRRTREVHLCPAGTSVHRAAGTGERDGGECGRNWGPYQTAPRESCPSSAV